MSQFTIGQLEQAINRARAAAPSSGHESTLSADVAVLADIYGEMIFLRQSVMDPGSLDERHREVLMRWVI